MFFKKIKDFLFVFLLVLTFRGSDKRGLGKAVCHGESPAGNSRGPKLLSSGNN